MTHPPHNEAHSTLLLNTACACHISAHASHLKATTHTHSLRVLCLDSADRHNRVGDEEAAIVCQGQIVTSVTLQLPLFSIIISCLFVKHYDFPLCFQLSCTCKTISNYSVDKLSVFFFSIHTSKISLKLKGIFRGYQV